MAEVQLSLHDMRTITHHLELYHGWPTVGRRRNGELLVVCSGGRERHIWPFGRVELIRSSDGGQELRMAH
jgi:sialidase-1